MSLHPGRAELDSEFMYSSYLSDQQTWDLFSGGWDLLWN